MAKKATWKMRINSWYQESFAEVGVSTRGPNLITVRASRVSGNSRDTAVARLTVEGAIELRRALSRAIRQATTVAEKVEP